MAIDLPGGKRLEILLGGPLPDDPDGCKEALEGLRERLRERRVAAERLVATETGLAAALPLIEHDIVLRTSPQLRELQERADALRRRVWQARHEADRIMWNLLRWQHTINARADAAETPGVGGVGADIVDDFDSLPAVVRMREVAEEFSDVRERTDRIGRGG